MGGLLVIGLLGVGVMLFLLFLLFLLMMLMMLMMLILVFRLCLDWPASSGVCRIHANDANHANFGREALFYGGLSLAVGLLTHANDLLMMPPYSEKTP